MKKLIAALKKIFKRKESEARKDFRYVFDFDHEEVVARARSVNAVALEAGAHLASLSAILNTADSNEGMSAETVDALNDAMQEAAHSVGTAMSTLQHIIKKASAESYASFDIKTGERLS